MGFNLFNVLFGSNKEHEEETRMPRRFISVRWSEAAEKDGVSGNRNKRIHVIEQGEVKHSYRYSEALLEAKQEEQNMPVIDETGGSISPEPDTLLTYLPTRIAKDQRNIERLKKKEQR